MMLQHKYLSFRLDDCNDDADRDGGDGPDDAMTML